MDTCWTPISRLSGLQPQSRFQWRRAGEIQQGALYLSVISDWEVLLKGAKGKLDVGDPRAWRPEALDKLTATALPLRAEHISEIYNIEPIHNDPFDLGEPLKPFFRPT